MSNEKNPSGRYSLEQIQSMPTIHQGHYDNLKAETFNSRLWLSRMTVKDGMPYDNQVTEEALVGGKWITVEEYEAKPERKGQKNA